MAAIDAMHRTDLERLARELRRTARTVRAGTLAERDTARRILASAIRRDLEPHAQRDEPGLEALRLWTAALESAEVTDVDHLQELLYGLDALVRLHLWRETGLELRPPEPRPASDI